MTSFCGKKSSVFMGWNFCFQSLAVVAVSTTMVNPANAQNSASSEVYKDTKSVITKLIERSAASGLDAAIRCDSEVLAAYLRRSLNQMVLGNWGALGQTFQQDMSVLAGDYTYLRLRYRDKVSSEAQALQSFTSKAWIKNNGNHWISFADDDEPVPDRQGEPLKCARPEDAPIPKRQVIYKSILENECIGSGGAFQMECSLALAVREGIGGNKGAMKGHFIDAIITAVKLKLKLGLADANRLRYWLSDPNRYFADQQSGRAKLQDAGLPPESEEHLNSLMSHVSKTWFAGQSGNDSSDISSSIFDIVAALKVAADATCESSIDDSVASICWLQNSEIGRMLNGLPRRGNATAPALLLARLLASTQPAIADEDQRNKSLNSDNVGGKPISRTSNPYHRFLTSIVAYVLSFDGKGEPGPVQREALVSAGEELLFSHSGGGFTRATWYRMNFSGLYPELSLRASWGYGYSSNGAEGLYRAQVSADWPVFRVAAYRGEVVHVGFQSSLLDALAPLSETATRPNGAYKNQNFLFLEMLRPRFEFWLGVPAITRNVTVKAGLGMRFVGSDRLSLGADGSKRFAYCSSFYDKSTNQKGSCAHDPTADLLNFGMSASYVF